MAGIESIAAGDRTVVFGVTDFNSKRKVSLKAAAKIWPAGLKEH
jgi:hypothetical protein